jgi:hypothetical protein
MLVNAQLYNIVEPRAINCQISTMLTTLAFLPPFVISHKAL